MTLIRHVERARRRHPSHDLREVIAVRSLERACDRADLLIKEDVVSDRLAADELGEGALTDHPLEVIAVAFTEATLLLVSDC